MSTDHSTESSDRESARLLGALLDPLAKEVARRLRQAEASSHRTTNVRPQGKDETDSPSSRQPK